MAKNTVLQFKITLLEIEPPIWRRIQVPANYTFWDLHVAIQDAMGWQNEHLHDFRIPQPDGSSLYIGIPDEDSPMLHNELAGWEVKVRRYLAHPGDEVLYVYDFGDMWKHSVVLGGILPAEPGQTYPRCLEGACACPPEDCGGSYGYERLLKAIANPKHERRQELLRRVGGSFDPEAFLPQNVTFQDPDDEWDRWFGE